MSKMKINHLNHCIHGNCINEDCVECEELIHEYSQYVGCRLFMDEFEPHDISMRDLLRDSAEN